MIRFYLIYVYKTWTYLLLSTFTSKQLPLFLCNVADKLGTRGNLCLVLQITHIYKIGTPLNEWSAHRRGHCLHNTQQTQELKIHALGGIRTRDFYNRAATDLRVRPHGHQNTQIIVSTDDWRIWQSDVWTNEIRI